MYLDIKVDSAICALVDQILLKSHIQTKQALSQRILLLFGHFLGYKITILTQNQSKFPITRSVHCKFNSFTVALQRTRQSIYSFTMLINLVPLVLSFKLVQKTCTKLSLQLRMRRSLVKFVEIAKICYQHGHSVSKNDKSGCICSMILKVVFCKVSKIFDSVY